MAGEGDYKPPKGHDRHLNDSERAHSGAAGSKVQHGMSAQEVVWDVKQAHPHYGYRKVHALANSLPESDKISMRQVRKHLGVGTEHKGQYIGEDDD